MKSTPIDIDTAVVTEIIGQICELMGSKEFDKAHSAVALKCILRTLENEGYEVEVIEVPEEEWLH